jgi:hypothetical protein
MSDALSKLLSFSSQKVSVVVSRCSKVAVDDLVILLCSRRPFDVVQIEIDSIETEGSGL